MTLTAQEIAARLHEHNQRRRKVVEGFPMTPWELGIIIDAAVILLNRHPTERIHINYDTYSTTTRPVS